MALLLVTDILSGRHFEYDLPDASETRCRNVVCQKTEKAVLNGKVEDGS